MIRLYMDDVAKEIYPAGLPKYETELAAGMDLRAIRVIKHYNELNKQFVIDPDNIVITLEPGQRMLIGTGIFMEMSKDVEAQIRPRSGLALKYGITVLNSPGTVDEDYRGEVGVILVNTSAVPFTFESGERIAQMVFNEVKKPIFQLVKTAEQLSKTGRGDTGFNNTGRK